MKSKYVLAGFALAVVVLVVALLALQLPSVKTEAALPGTQAGAQVPPVPPCAELTGVERERCMAMAHHALEQPRNYEMAPEGPDASMNTARAARGTGVEGVSSAETTHAPPRQ